MMNEFSYGFCIPDNKYDSFIFRVKLCMNITKDLRIMSELIPEPEDEEEFMCAEEIRLKYDALNLVLLGYLRTVFKNYYILSQRERLISSAKLHESPQQVEILLTKPKDINFEIFIFEKYLALMEHLKTTKEKSKTLEDDLSLLEDYQRKGVSFEERFVIRYRAEKKKIIRSNIDLAQFVLGILRKLNEQMDKNTQKNSLTEEEFKQAYMSKSKLEEEGVFRRWIIGMDFDEEENFYRRRLQIRDYLKDLAELTSIITL